MSLSVPYKSASTVYFRLLNLADKTIYNRATGLVTAAPPIADTFITGTFVAVADICWLDIPTGLTSGDWGLLIYSAASAGSWLSLSVITLYTDFNGTSIMKFVST